MKLKNEVLIWKLISLVAFGMLLAGGLWWLKQKSTWDQQSTFPDISSVDLASDKGIDYSKLRSQLQKHNWQGADQTTTEVLLKAFGPKSYATGHVNSQEAQFPPCQDIQTVDKLWMAASKGLLGFSAQQEVFKQAGGDYRLAYNKLQWQRPGGEWLIQYNYDGHREHFKPGYEPDYGNPDKGHLPTIERGYNFKYSLNDALVKCGIK